MKRVLVVMAVVLLNFTGAAGQPPDNPRFREALGAVQRKDWLSAQRLLEALVRAHPHSALYWFNLGNVQFLRQDFVAAKVNYEKVLSLPSKLAIPARIYLLKTCLRIRDLRCAYANSLAIDLEALPEGLRSEASESQRELAYALIEKGMDALRKDQIETALRWFRLSARVQTSPESQILMGICCRRLGQYRRGRKLIRAALARIDARDEARDLRQFLKEMDRASAPHAKTLSLDFGAKYDTNVFRDGVNSEPVDRVGIVSYLGYAHPVSQSPNFAVHSTSKVGFEEFQDLPAQRYLEAATGLRVARSGTPLTWSFQPALSYSEFGGEPFQMRVSLGAAAGWSLGESGVALEVFYEEIWPQSQDFSHLRGHFLSTALSYRFGRFPEWTTFFYFETNESESFETGGATLPLAYEGFGGGLRIKQPWSDAWVTRGEVNYLRADYRDRFLPQNETRLDQQIRLSAVAEYLIQSNLTVYLNLEHAQTDSTMGEESAFDRNIRHQLVNLGLIWTKDL